MDYGPIFFSFLSPGKKESKALLFSTSRQGNVIMNQDKTREERINNSLKEQPPRGIKQNTILFPKVKGKWKICWPSHKSKDFSIFYSVFLDQLPINTAWWIGLPQTHPPTLLRHLHVIRLLGFWNKTEKSPPPVVAVLFSRRSLTATISRLQRYLSESVNNRNRLSFFPPLFFRD